MSEHWYLYRIEGMPDEMVGPYTIAWTEIPPEYVEVAILPVAELDVLRLREFDWERYNVLDSEVDRLRAMEARVRDETTARDAAFVRDDEWLRRSRRDAIDAYRAAVLGKGKP